MKFCCWLNSLGSWEFIRHTAKKKKEKRKKKIIKILNAKLNKFYVEAKTAAPAATASNVDRPS